MTPRAARSRALNHRQPDGFSGGLRARRWSPACMPAPVCAAPQRLGLGTDDDRVQGDEPYEMLASWMTSSTALLGDDRLFHRRSIFGSRMTLENDGKLFDGSKVLVPAESHPLGRTRRLPDVSAGDHSAPPAHAFPGRLYFDNICVSSHRR